MPRLTRKDLSAVGRRAAQVAASRSAGFQQPAQSGVLPRVDEVLGTAWFAICFVDAGNYMADLLAAPVFALFVLGTLIYLLAFRPQLVQMVFFNAPSLVWTFSYLTPLVLMFLSETEFERSEITSAVTVFAAVVISAALAYAQARWVRNGAFVAFCIAVLLNLFEVVAPNTFSTSPGRSAGFYINPNLSAAMVGLLFILSARFDSRTFSARDVGLLYAMAAGVLPTYSRTAILLTVPLAMTYLFFRLRQTTITLFGVLTGVGGFFMLIYVLQWVIARASTEYAYNQLLSLMSGDPLSAYQSERGDLAARFFSMIGENPFLGHGVSTVVHLEEGPHNQYIALLVDYGVLGLLVFIAIVGWSAVTLARALWFSGARARELTLEIFVGLSFLTLIAFSSHNLLSALPFGVFFGVLSAQLIHACRTLRTPWLYQR
jgi:O-antigen ligase